MIEVIEEILKDCKTAPEKYQTLREYLQLLILKILDEKGMFRKISFLGGTALRILYNLNRFSEDLDFNLIPHQTLDFPNMMRTIQSELNLMGLNVTIKNTDKNTVAIAEIKFSELLLPLNLSDLVNQKIMIKFEVDQNPPEGFSNELSLINKYFLLNINHLDQPSLFSGKLLALFCRPYTKGRDYYDLMWYLSKNIPANFNYLNSGLAQQKQAITCHSNDELKMLLREKIKQTNFKKVLTDVEAFLFNPTEARFFSEEVFLGLLTKYLN